MAKRASKKPTAADTSAVEVMQEPKKAKEAAAPQEEAPVVLAKPVAKNIDPNQTVVVRNGFQGRLTFKSRKTGEKWIWSEFGKEQDMELSELRNARSSNKKFFENNWFMFDEDWIVDYLGVRQYYKNALRIDHFDDVFRKSPEEIIEVVSKLSDGQKKSLGYRAKLLIEDETIDSRRAIAALEESLGIELIEK